MARMARRAAPDGSIRIERSYVVTSEAPSLNRSRAFQGREGVRGPVNGTWVESFAERDLSIGQLRRATNRRPGG